MSIGVNTMIGKPTKTVDLNQWELTDSRLTTEEPSKHDLGSLNADDGGCLGSRLLKYRWRWVAWAVCGATGSGKRSYPYCIIWIFEVHFL